MLVGLFVTLISRVQGGHFPGFVLKAVQAREKWDVSESPLYLHHLNGLSLRKELKQQCGDFSVHSVHALPRAVTLSKCHRCPCLPSLGVNENVNISSPSLR